jgi:hypothetical protein
LTPQLLADVRQRRTGAIADIARRLDRASDRRHLGVERGDASGNRGQRRVAAVATNAGRHVVRRIRQAREAQQRQRVERLLVDREHGEDRVQILRRRDRQGTRLGDKG